MILITHWDPGNREFMEDLFYTQILVIKNGSWDTSVSLDLKKLIWWY